MKFPGSHLKQYQEIASLLWKYGRSDLVRQMGLVDILDRQAEESDSDAGPEDLADDLEAMGPTYIKLGQVLAGRPDLLPTEYAEALKRLQDHVKPFPYVQVEEIVQEELGVRLSKAFASFEAEPIAAASLGQVHAAELRDGRKVVVKVQRPDIRDKIHDDFEVLGQIAGFLDEHTDLGRKYRFSRIVDEFRRTIHQEMNYEREAQNLLTMATNLEDYRKITVPLPVHDYSTHKVLTMDYVKGQKIESVGPLGRLDMDGDVLVEELFRAYLKQVLVDGVFHADPHPGNIFLTDSGQIALLDLGMVGYCSPRTQDNLLGLLMHISDGQSDDAADLVMRICQVYDRFDRDAFRHRIAQILGPRKSSGLQKLNVGRSLMEALRAATDNGLIVPSELTLLAKTLTQLEEVGRILDPTFDSDASVKRNVSELMRRRMRAHLTPTNLVSSALAMSEFTKGLPGRVNDILDALNNRDLEIKVNSIDAELMMEGLQKIANRITMGLVLAALVIGASLIMRIQTSFTLAGYPGLAILLFIGAAIGAVWLLLSIAMGDRKAKHQKH